MKKVLLITILIMIVFTTVAGAATYQDVDMNKKPYGMTSTNEEVESTWAIDETNKAAIELSKEIFKDGMTTREKVAELYFWFAENWKYDLAYSGESVRFSIRDKRGVCQQYAEFGADVLAVSGVRTYTLFLIPENHLITVYMMEDGSWLSADFTSADISGYDYYNSEYGMSKVEYVEKYKRVGVHSGLNRDGTIISGRYGDDTIRHYYNKYYFPRGHFSKKVELPKFTDVASSSWYHNYVYEVLETGLMIGSNGMFNPDKDLSIGEVVTVAARLYAKVSQGEIRGAKTGEHWTAPYVEYALKYKIVDSEFVSNLNKKATREELAYALLGAYWPLKTREAIYTIDDVTPKYQKAVLIMHEAEILNGVGNSLAPKALCNRAQLATMLVRLLK
jgi:hypothetical protein